MCCRFSLAVSLSGKVCYKFGQLGDGSEYLVPHEWQGFPGDNGEIFQVSAAGENCMFLVVQDEEQRCRSVFTYGSDGDILMFLMSL